jgi:hypothetical protein
MHFPQTGEESVGSCKMRNIVTLTAVVVLSTGCFEAQRAAGCNNVGILGCKDDPAAIEQPDSALQPAPLGGRRFPRPELRHGPPESDDAGGFRSNQYSWIQPLNECMAAGEPRTDCIEGLPPEVLIQFEAWEAESAAIRRRQFERRQELDDSSAFGMSTDEPGT